MKVKKLPGGKKVTTYTLEGEYQHEESGGRIYDRYVGTEHIDEWIERIFHGILPEKTVRITIEVLPDAQ